MIRPDDAIALPPGVRLAGDMLHDDVRGIVIAVNATGAAALGATTPHRAAAELVRRYGIDERCALRDVTAFCMELNARYLLNVSFRNRARALLALPAHRRAVDTSTVRATTRTATRALRELALELFALGASVAAATFVVVGAGSPGLALAVGVAVSLVVVLHELAHLFALRGVPSFVARRGLHVSVVHRRVSPRRSLIVAAAGPLSGVAPTALALAALTAAPAAEWAVIATTFSLNAIGLTVLSRDGRALCGLS
jgi:hypothetical protein